MDEIKVSVIVPVYNSSSFLKRCIDSLVNQTLNDIEIIIINDGSTDDSEEIIKSYNDPRIVLISKENEGLSATRNLGMKVAQGKYISFVDSDDWVELNFLEKLYTAVEKHGAEIAVAGIIRLHTTNKKYHIKYDKEIVTFDISEKLRLCDVPDKCYVWNKLYLASMLREKGVQFVVGRLFEDIMFTPEVLYYSDKMVVVPETFYYYWRHSGSIVASKTKKAIEDVEFAKMKMKEFLAEHNIDVSSHETINKRYQLFGITLFKIQIRGDRTKYSLLNLIKWETKRLR